MSDKPKKPKKKPKYNANSQIRSAIRRAFSRSPMVIETLRKSRREVVWYKKDGTPAAKKRVEHQCAECKEWYMRKHIEVDHEDPVVPPSEGFSDWNTYIQRLFFSGDDNLRVLCDTCHKTKTDKEKAIAAERRRTLKAQATKV